MVEIKDKIEIDKYLDKIKNKIIPKISPEKIYLFGSYANNDYNNDSDLDLFFVINNDESPREIQRKISSLLKDRIMPIDIIVCSQERMEKRKDIIGTLPYQVNQEGELIYEKPRNKKSK